MHSLTIVLSDSFVQAAKEREKCCVLNRFWSPDRLLRASAAGENGKKSDSFGSGKHLVRVSSTDLTFSLHSLNLR